MRKSVVWAGLAFLAASGFLAYRLIGVPVGGPAGAGRATGHAPSNHNDPAGGPSGARTAGAQSGQPAAAGMVRPPASPAKAIALGLAAEASSERAINAYVIHGPGRHGFTQQDAEWMVEVVTTHADVTTRRRAMTGIGWALAGVEGGFPEPTYDEPARQAMEAAVLRCIRDPSADMRRSAVAAALNAPGLRDREDVHAELTRIAASTDRDISYWAKERLKERAKSK